MKHLIQLVHSLKLERKIIKLYLVVTIIQKLLIYYLIMVQLV